MKTKTVPVLFAVILGWMSVITIATYSVPASKAGESIAESAQSIKPVEKEEPAPLVQCAAGAAKQQCCSARSCTGKVLSNRDKHNCKDKSKGKSWHAANSNTCINL